MSTKYRRPAVLMLSEVDDVDALPLVRRTPSTHAVPPTPRAAPTASASASAPALDPAPSASPTTTCPASAAATAEVTMVSASATSASSAACTCPGPDAADGWATRVRSEAGSVCGRLQPDHGRITWRSRAGATRAARASSSPAAPRVNDAQYPAVGIPAVEKAREARFDSVRLLHTLLILQPLTRQTTAHGASTCQILPTFAPFVGFEGLFRLCPQLQ